MTHDPNSPENKSKGSQDKNTVDPLQELARLIGLDDVVTPPPAGTKIYATSEPEPEVVAEQIAEIAPEPIIVPDAVAKDVTIQELIPELPLPFDVKQADEMSPIQDDPLLWSRLKEIGQTGESLTSVQNVRHEPEVASIENFDDMNTHSVQQEVEAKELADAPAFNPFVLPDDVRNMIETEDELPLGTVPSKPTDDMEAILDRVNSNPEKEPNIDEFPLGPAPWQTSNHKPLFEIEPDPTFKENNAYLVTEDDPLPVFQDDQIKPKYTGLLIVAGVLLVGIMAAVAALFFRGASLNSEGATPIIKAENAPIKIAPENPGGKEIPNQNKQIYERVGQNPPDAKIVSREELPIEIPSRLAHSSSVNTTDNQANPAPNAAQLDEPKKVKVLTIGPDGNIVAKDSVAPEQAPAIIPDSKIVADTERTISNAPVPQPRGSQSTQPKTQSRVDPATKPVTPSRVEPTQPKAAQSGPMSIRPQDVLAGQNNAPSRTQVAQSESTRAPKSENSGGGYLVQLSSSPSESDAKASFSRLSKKHSALSGMQPNIASVNLGAKGTFYRLRVGPFSKDKAQDFCAELKRSGGSCIVQSGG